MKLFLDLEDTVIDSIDTGNILSQKLKHIKSFIQRQNASIESVETFTFAMYDDIDRMKVTSAAKHLSFEFNRVVRVQDWWTKDLKKETVESQVFKISELELIDFFPFANKERCFEFFVLKNFPGEECLLIDDTVRHKNIRILEKGLSTRIAFVPANTEKELQLSLSL